MRHEPFRAPGRPRACGATVDAAFDRHRRRQRCSRRRGMPRAFRRGLGTGCPERTRGGCARAGDFHLPARRQIRSRGGDRTPPPARRRGIVAACTIAPAIFVEDALGIELLDRGGGSALSLLFACTGSAVCTLSGIMATWAPPDGSVGAADPRLQRVIPPYGGHGPVTPWRAFRAQPYAIAMATGALTAIVLRQFLDLAWGLAVLNGLAAGGLALALAIGGDAGRRLVRRHGHWPETVRRPGSRHAETVMVAPALLVQTATSSLSSGRPEVAVSLLFDVLPGRRPIVLGGCSCAALEHLGTATCGRARRSATASRSRRRPAGGGGRRGQGR